MIDSHKKKTRKKAKKRLFNFFRWLHIYCSTALLSLLIFFAVTGITLNHRWYDSKGNKNQYIEFDFNKGLLTALNSKHDGENWAPDINAITTYLSEEHGLNSTSGIDIDHELNEIVVEYRAPASFASAIFSLEENLLILEKESGSTLGVLNDLHKGRHSGAVWRWLIDISAILMIVFSFSGMVILYQGRKYRTSGTWLAILGTLTPVVIYFIAAPRI